jgi:hypothetical protein
MTTLASASPPSSRPRPTRGAASRGRLPMTPGRAVALLLGVPIVLAVIAYNGYDLVLNVGKGSYPVSYSVPVAADGLTVNLGGGAATVRGGTSAAGVARVSGTVTYHLGRASVSREAGNLGLDCPWFDEGNCSLNATVTLPRNTPLTMTTGGGDLTASDLTGGARLSTGGGNINLTGAVGPLSLSSSGGDVTVSDVSGPTATISTFGGNDNGTGVAIPEVSARTYGGDITLKFAAAATLDSLNVTTLGGNVTIIVPPGDYHVIYNTDSGRPHVPIKNDPKSPDVINVTSEGGDISITES